MAAITVRNLDDDVRERLRVRAATNGRSMEAEIRSILSDSVAQESEANPFILLYERFQELGGVDLEIPSRDARPRPVDFT